MKQTFKIFLVIYLILALLLSLLPLTGAYGAIMASPVVGFFLFKKLILAEKSESELISRRIFLFASLIILFGFVFNVFCSTYTTWRQSELREVIINEKDRIQKSIPVVKPEKK